MESLKGDTFFSAADGRIATRLTREDFEWALVHTLLLEPRIVLPDIFFFISKHLRDHVLESRDGRRSLFELAIKEGYIIPGVRDTVEDFGAIHTSVQDVYSPISRPDMKALADRFSRSQPTNFSPILWPKRMGQRYYERLDKCLRQPQYPPSIGSTTVSKQLWSLTEPFRIDVINEARQVELARKKHRYGVRRGEIVRLVGRRLGVVGPNEFVGDADVILRRYAAAVSTLDKRYRAASAFFDWLDELYRLNLSLELKVGPNVVNGGIDDLAVLGPAFADHQQHLGSHFLDKQSHSDTLDVTIKLPAIARLLEMHSGDILSLKEGGSAWYQAAAEFARSPSDRTRHTAEAALEKYSKSLCSGFNREALESVSVKTIALRGIQTVGPSLAGIELERHGFPKSTPVLLSALQWGYMVFRWVAKNRKEPVRIIKSSSNNLILRN